MFDLGAFLLNLQLGCKKLYKPVKNPIRNKEFFAD